jgi:hypothetical protein
MREDRVVRAAVEHDVRRLPLAQRDLVAAHLHARGGAVAGLGHDQERARGQVLEREAAGLVRLHAPVSQAALAGQAADVDVHARVGPPGCVEHLAGDPRGAGEAQLQLEVLAQLEVEVHQLAGAEAGGAGPQEARSAARGRDVEAAPGVGGRLAREGLDARSLHGRTGRVQHDPAHVSLAHHDDLDARVLSQIEPARAAHDQVVVGPHGELPFARRDALEHELAVLGRVAPRGLERAGGPPPLVGARLEDLDREVEHGLSVRQGDEPAQGERGPRGAGPGLARELARGPRGLGRRPLCVCRSVRRGPVRCGPVRCGPVGDARLGRRARGRRALARLVRQEPEHRQGEQRGAEQPGDEGLQSSRRRMRRSS